MPDYDKIAAKNKDIDNIKNSVSVKSLTEQRTYQKGVNDVRQKFKDYSENLNSNGDKAKNLSIQKPNSKVKDYFYSEKEGNKLLQVHKKSENQDRYKIIEGNKAERKMNRVIKRN